jgi:hypothetical protein
MRVVDAPTIGNPQWNKFRGQVIATITDVEVLMQHRGKGVDNEGMTYEVASRMGLQIETQDDFDLLARLVRATRPISREQLRSTREDHGGQYTLLLL